MSSIHGVFMSVFGVGTLITGGSGIGKSDLALSLIDRGHRLIADDMVEFSARDDNRLWGRSPGLLKNYLGIRDLGVLNITQLFGPQSILEEKELSLVIQLEKSVTSPHEISLNDKPWVLQGVTAPSFCLSLSEGRPRDLLLEMCVRNYQLIQKGHQPNQDFLENHHKKMSIPA